MGTAKHICVAGGMGLKMIKSDVILEWPLKKEANKIVQIQRKQRCEKYVHTEIIKKHKKKW